MKKLSILFLSALALGTTVTSCSKNDSPASVVGKWQFNTMEGTYGTQSIPAGTGEQMWSDPSCSNIAFWQFDKGTAMHMGIYDSTQNCALSTIDVTYAVDSKNITITAPDGTKQVCPIIKLTATELVWRDQGTDQDSSGNSVVYNIVHNMIKK